MDDSMTPETARVYRAALTYGLDEMRVSYAAAVTFASWHASRGQLLWEGDLDRSWQDWAQRPDADPLLGGDDS